MRQLGRGSGHETVVFLVQDSRVQASSLQIMILQHQACRSCTAASSSLYHLVCSAYAATSVQVIQCCVCLSAQHFAFGYSFLCGMTQICRALQGASILSTCVCVIGKVAVILGCTCAQIQQNPTWFMALVVCECLLQLPSFLVFVFALMHQVRADVAEQALSMSGVCMPRSQFAVGLHMRVRVYSLPIWVICSWALRA